MPGMHDWVTRSLVKQHSYVSRTSTCGGARAGIHTYTQACVPSRTADQESLVVVVVVEEVEHAKSGDALHRHESRWDRVAGDAAALAATAAAAAGVFFLLHAQARWLRFAFCRREKRTRERERRQR